MRWSATENRFAGPSGQEDEWQGVDRDELDLYARRSRPDWGLVGLVLGYGALIGGVLLLF